MTMIHVGPCISSVTNTSERQITIHPFRRDSNFYKKIAFSKLNVLVIITKPGSGIHHNRHYEGKGRGGGVLLSYYVEEVKSNVRRSPNRIRW